MLLNSIRKRSRFEWHWPNSALTRRTVSVRSRFMHFIEFFGSSEKLMPEQINQIQIRIRRRRDWRSDYTISRLYNHRNGARAGTCAHTLSNRIRLASAFRISQLACVRVSARARTRCHGRHAEWHSLTLNCQLLATCATVSHFINSAIQLCACDYSTYVHRTALAHT